MFATRSSICTLSLVGALSLLGCYPGDPYCNLVFTGDCLPTFNDDPSYGPGGNSSLPEVVVTGQRCDSGLYVNGECYTGGDDPFGGGEGPSVGGGGGGGSGGSSGSNEPPACTTMATPIPAAAAEALRGILDGLHLAEIAYDVADTTIQCALRDIQGFQMGAGNAGGTCNGLIDWGELAIDWNRYGAANEPISPQGAANVFNRFAREALRRPSTNTGTPGGSDTPRQPDDGGC